MQNELAALTEAAGLIDLSARSRLCLLGEDAVLSTIAALEPRAGARGEGGGEVQALHRDGLGGGVAVKGLEGCQSLWLIDPMNPQNGATRFGIGTHRLAGPEDTSNEDWVRGAGRLLQMSLPAGCVAIYDARTMHAMSTNHSGRRRGRAGGTRCSPVEARAAPAAA